MKIVELIANGDITVEELASAKELIERAELVKKGVEACFANLAFPIGCDEINCFDYWDRAGEYHSWCICNKEGVLTFFSNWGGDHISGQVWLEFSEIFMALEDEAFKSDLRRFLLQQIEKANATR